MTSKRDAARNSTKPRVIRLLLALFAAASFDAAGIDQPVSAGTVALESAFWQCDFDATELGIGEVDAVACTAVYDMLKQRKFAGDFEKLLRWWERNKLLEHAKLRARSPPMQAPR